MRAVVQRVKNAKVETGGSITGEISVGLVVFLGVEEGDTQKDADYIFEKSANLRIFHDAEGKMNRSVLEQPNPQMLVISQFTLSGDCRRGRRPSFITAARPEEAVPLYEYYIKLLKDAGIKAESGVFQADMDVTLCNWGPVTILLDSRKIF